MRQQSTSKKVVKINVIEQRLADEKRIKFYSQGSSIIRSEWDPNMGLWRENQLHYSTDSVAKAVAECAHLVLRPGETLSAKYF